MPMPPPIQDLPPLPDPNRNNLRVVGKANILDAMTVAELLELRTQVELRLPARDLKDLDLARELVLQVLALQQMQMKALQEDDTPVNQLAQAANSLSAALTNLVKLQESVYNSERLKKIETILIDVLQKLPSDAQEEFINAYETSLKGQK